MGFYVVEDTITTISGLTIGQALYEAALIIAVLRWILCLVFKVMRDRHSDDDSLHTTTSHETDLSSEMIRDNTLLLTTFGEIVERLPETQDTTTCAVCLNHLNMEDEVRELMNCYHVFHKECIDTWLDHDHDNHNPTCPLCRAPLLTPCCFSSSSESESTATTTCVPPPQPSWAVERLLYLFGDDLLPC